MEGPALGIFPSRVPHVEVVEVIGRLCKERGQKLYYLRGLLLVLIIYQAWIMWENGDIATAPPWGLLITSCKLGLATLPDVHGTTFLPTVPPRLPTLVANVLVGCFACVGYVVLRHVGLSAGVVVHSRRGLAGGAGGVILCEDSAKATPRRVFER